MPSPGCMERPMAGGTELSKCPRHFTELGTCLPLVAGSPSHAQTDLDFEQESTRLVGGGLQIFLPIMLAGARRRDICSVIVWHSLKPADEPADHAHSPERGQI